MDIWKDTMMRRLSSKPSRRRKKKLSRYTPEVERMAVPEVGVSALFDKGSMSPFHSEIRAHENAINIAVTVPLTKADDSANVALDAILSAGRHGDAYPNQVLLDGPNDMGATESVQVSVDYGRAGVGSMENFQKMCEDKGVIFAGMQYEYFDAQTGTTLAKTQLVNKFKFTYIDEWGKHDYRELNPKLHYSNMQYDQNMINMNSRFTLDRDTILQLKINPGITVIVTLFVEEVLNVNKLLKQRAIQKNTDLTLVN